MRTQELGSTVLLSDGDVEPSLIEMLTFADRQPACFASVAELVRTLPLSSIGILVLLFHPLPKGVLLVTLGRMNLEYPGIQKLALLEVPPPLPIAEYLTACGVDLLLDGSHEESTDRLASAIDSLHARTRWIAS